MLLLLLVITASCKLLSAQFYDEETGEITCLRVLQQVRNHDQPQAIWGWNSCSKLLLLNTASLEGKEGHNICLAQTMKAVFSSSSNETSRTSSESVNISEMSSLFSPARRCPGAKWSWGLLKSQNFRDARKCIQTLHVVNETPNTFKPEWTQKILCWV